MITKLQDFIDKDPKNRFYIVGLLASIFSIIAYFAIAKKEKNNASIDNRGDINVITKDTVFKETKSGYYKQSISDNTRKKIINNDDFYDLQEKVEDLKKGLEKDTIKNKKSLEDINLIKKAIIEQQAQANKETSKRQKYYKNKKTVKKSSEKVEDWKAQLEKDAEDFFYSPSANIKEDSKKFKEKLKTDVEIYAVVSGTQVVKNNSRITMRLANDVYIDGIKHKRNSLVYGFVMLSKHRVFIKIKDINDVNVDLSVYDAQDNGKGLHTEIDFSSKVSSEVKDDIIDEVNVPSVPVINTVKNLVKRKNKQDDITINNNIKLTFKMD